jgi:ribonucleoside-diphosphate reductase beta chain
MIDMFKEACEQEKEWAEYLFRDGSMIGLNAEILISSISRLLR